MNFLKRVIYYLKIDFKRSIYLVLFLFSFKKFSPYKHLLDKRTLILEIPEGGLGDHLIYSHIPRIAKQTKKYDRVYISNFSKFRRAEHKTYIWAMNPYIDGFIDLPGKIVRFYFDESKFINKKNNLLDMIMKFYGLNDNKKAHLPEIYYKPKKLKNLCSLNIAEFNFVSNLYDKTFLTKLYNYFKINKIKIDAQFETNNTLNKLSNKFINDKSFGEFCDIVYSCNHIYCLASGTSILLAAFNKFDSTVFYSKKVDKKFLVSPVLNYMEI